MFVLMVAELPPALSEVTPELSRRARLGNRFQYWCGQSGMRYLFSAVPFDTLADFRSAVAILAEPTADGRFVAWAAAIIDSDGRLHATNNSWPEMPPTGSIAFVHFLAESDSERQLLIDEIFPPALSPTFSLAA